MIGSAKTLFPIRSHSQVPHGTSYRLSSVMVGEKTVSVRVGETYRWHLHRRGIAPPNQLGRGEERSGSSQGRQVGVSSFFSLDGSNWGKFLGWRMEPVLKARVGRDSGWNLARGRKEPWGLAQH